MAQTRGSLERPHQGGTTATLGTVQKHCTAGPRHRVVQLTVQFRQNLYASGEGPLRRARARSNPWGIGWCGGVMAQYCVRNAPGASWS
jgi:hypothetical protein